MNRLYFGDNLPILRENIADESVDLVYLDPPFNSNAMMAQRMAELHRVLKPTGSIYLHCDPTASHYLKLMMDAMFGQRNFRNEVVWRRYGAHNDAGQGSEHFGRIHDVIFVYGKSDTVIWNQEFVPLDESYIKSTYRQIDNESGRQFSTTPLTGPGGAEKGNPVYEWNGHTRAWRYSIETMQQLHDEGRLYYSKTGYPRGKLYLDESKGVPIQDIWTDISSLSGRHKERLNFQTQKPEALLERIINASSNEGDVVLDPFCGCGTAVTVAERLNRRWIGIDITHLAISLMKSRLRDTFGSELADYAVIGVPQDVESARALAVESEHDGRYQFEYWALGLIDARPSKKGRRGADSGLDGFINFFDDNTGKAKRIIVQVKSGQVRRDMIATLKGDMARENAEIGLFITLEAPTRPMIQEAAAAGIYTPGQFPNHDYPRVQILTIEDLLSGVQAEVPRYAPDPTRSRAPRRRQSSSKQRLIA